MKFFASKPSACIECNIPVGKAKLEYIEINGQRLNMKVRLTPTVDKIDHEVVLTLRNYFRKKLLILDGVTPVKKLVVFSITISIFTVCGTKCFHATFSDKSERYVHSLALGLVFNKDYKISIPMDEI